jgi:hypothetical protein
VFAELFFAFVLGSQISKQAQNKREQQKRQSSHYYNYQTMCRPGSYNVQAINAAALGFVQTTPVKSSQPESATSSTSAIRKHHPHIVVQHHYHDHANEDDSIEDRPARGGVTTPFPIRLHKMLDKMEADGHGDVISWQPHGRCFVVRKPKEFKELLPTYFKLSKMSSFQRQLNLYGFQRLTRGRDKNGYYHEYFFRGKPALSHKIQRTKVKGTGVRARSNPTSEPHLWEMTWVGTDAVSAHQHHHCDSGSVSSPETTPTITLKEMPQLCSSFTAQSSSSFGMPPLTGSAYAPQYYQQHEQLEEPEQDVVMSFGGKRFHYLDPQEMMKEALLRKKQQEACQRDDMQSFMTNLELDGLYNELYDEVVDNDDAFMDMLERVIE